MDERQTPHPQWATWEGDIFKKECITYSNNVTTSGNALPTDLGLSVVSQTDTSASDRTPTVVLDIESLAQPSDRSSGSPKMTRALSRKWSYRAERFFNTDEEDTDEAPKKLLVKVNSQLEPLKQSLITAKAILAASNALTGSNLVDTGDGRSKRLNRFMAINPRKILFIFATLSSMGTLILIYFTLAINRTV